MYDVSYTTHMRTQLNRYVDWAWGVMAIVWLIGAIRTKPTARSQSAASRVVHIALLGAAFVMMFGRVPLGPLDLAMFPESAMIAYGGLALVVAGVALAIWARFMLGGNWSASVTIKDHHTITRSGPYRMVRHPIYSGILLGLLGTALVQNRVRQFIGLVLVFIAMWTKLQIEEQFLERQFGPEYLEYKRNVRALIPFVL